MAVAAIVQLATLVLAHDLVYLARYGSRYGEALVHAGHGNGWQAAVTTSAILAGIAALVVTARLVRLHVLLRRSRAGGTLGRLDRRGLIRTWVRIAPALALATVGLLTVQENLEQLARTGTVAGLGILLTPEYAGGLWIALAVGLVIGFVIALVAWRLNVLEARLRVARACAQRMPVEVTARWPRVVDQPIASILGRRSALRAPPVALPAS